MARGMLSGLIWGGVVAVGAVGLVSLAVPLPPPPQVDSATPAATAPSSPADTDIDPSNAGREGQRIGTLPNTPDAPQADSLAALDTADTASADVPSVGNVSPLGGTAAPETEAPSVAVAPSSPQAPSASIAAPSAPEAEEDLTISTEPAQPAPPPVVAESSGFTDPPAAPEQPAAPVVAEEGSGFDTAPAADSTRAAEPAPQAPVTTEQDEPSTPAAPAQTAEVTTPESEPVAETPDPEPAPRIAALPRVQGDETDESSEPAGPTIGQRVIPLTERNAGATALPTVTETVTEVETAAAAPDPASDLPPIERFAAAFDNAEGKPLMGIVLIDAEGSIGAEALASFPYPLSFAINPQDSDAAAKMARYRAAGFEVLALVDLPALATPQDAETALEVGMSTLDQAIGVLEGTGTGIQGNRPLSDQVTAILRDKGYGLITQNSGLNTVQKLAARDGVPSTFVFRDFDGAGQSPTVMRRFLDQAAFRAGQEGAVIMMGRVQPDTISALLLWGLQDRASRVALAPASAVLTAAPVDP